MDDELPLITIITVVYNGASSIKKTIESVLNLSYTKLNFIIIDGASTDGTVELIKQHQHKLTYWTSEPDKGIYDAMNKGWAKAAENSFIVFLGSGDCIINLPDMYKCAKHNIIYGRVDIGGKYIFNTKVDFRMKLVNSVHHQAELIKKSIHPAPPFSLDYSVFADFDFNQRLYKSGFEFYKDHQFLSYAMAEGVSTQTSKKEMLQIVQKNFGTKYYLLAIVYYMFQNIRKYMRGR